MIERQYNPDASPSDNGGDPLAANYRRFIAAKVWRHAVDLAYRTEFADEAVVFFLSGQADWWLQAIGFDDADTGALVKHILSTKPPGRPGLYKRKNNNRRR